MKIPKLLMLLLLLSALTNVIAQSPYNGHGCGMDQLIENYKTLDPEYQSKLEKYNKYAKEYKSKMGGNKTTLPLFFPATYVIPVVVHIMHDAGDGVGSGNNLDYTQIESQIDALNAAYAKQYGTSSYPNSQSHPSYAVNTGIQFCLAKTVMGPTGWTNSSEPGVMRYAVSSTIYNTTSTPPGGAVLKAVTHPAAGYFPFENYLNIWVVEGIDGNVNLIGYAPTPIMTYHPIDGVVIRGDAFGDNSVGGSWTLPALDQGKVLAHEIGHYLHLFHIFNPTLGICEGMNASGSSSDACDENGDFICDIEPSYPVSYSNCSSPPNSCTATYSTGTTANDMIEDYMSYADEGCQNTFTDDQRIRMWATLDAYRPNLFSLGNLSETGVLSSCVDPVFFCDIQTSNQNPCTGDPITIWNPTTGNTASSWSWSMPGASVTSATTASVNISYATPGVKTVTLVVSDGIETETCDIVIYVTPCTADPDILPQCQWTFGNQASLTFMPPVAGPNCAMNSSEACASICDGGGNLLFYTDGHSVWNAANTLISSALDGSPNSSGSSSGVSAASGVTIVPDPANANYYYVFYTPDVVFLNNYRSVVIYNC